MKKPTLILVLIIAGILTASAQTEEELVLKIREQFKTTNANLNAYEKIEKDIYSESTEGGTIRVYHIDGETVLMHCEFYGEGGNMMEEYYFWNSELYFVYTVQELYDRPIYMEGSKVSEKIENRYYFNNGKMIRWLDRNKQKVNKYADEYSEAEQQLLNESVRLIEVFNAAE
jgi:hypothetical protein